MEKKFNSDKLNELEEGSTGAVTPAKQTKNKTAKTEAELEKQAALDSLRSQLGTAEFLEDENKQKKS